MMESTGQGYDFQIDGPDSDNSVSSTRVKYTANPKPSKIARMMSPPASEVIDNIIGNNSEVGDKVTLIISLQGIRPPLVTAKINKLRDRGNVKEHSLALALPENLKGSGHSDWESLLETWLVPFIQGLCSTMNRDFEVMYVNNVTGAKW